ncbi:MAG: LysR substrate-binding domain-containing protein [Betaproteobacteria bacterium]
MNLQQLRYLSEVAKQGLNLSRAAQALHTSQPGISKQLRLLEGELGAELLVRQGNRITALTEPGQQALAIARRMLRDLDNLRRVGEQAADAGQGSLVIATTHAHARYVLIPVVQAFQQRFPGVHLSLRQGNPDQIVELIQTGAADLGLCTRPTVSTADLRALPCYLIRRCVLVTQRHPLLRKKLISHADLAQWPMITLDASFAGGVAVLSAFAQKNIAPKVVLSATDADVIKAFVASGMGIATLPEWAYSAERDVGLKSINARHLFPPAVSYLWLQPHQYLRGYALDFIQMLSRVWAPERVKMALADEQPLDDALAVDLSLTAERAAAPAKARSGRRIAASSSRLIST